MMQQLAIHTIGGVVTPAYLSGTNTRRVRRALAALFGGAVGKVHGQWHHGRQ